MTDEKYPSELADRFMVRMPDGMRARLAESARANARSMNAEAVARLQASFEGGADAAKLQTEVQELRKQLAAMGKVADVLEGSQAMLAQLVCGMFELLPDGVKEDRFFLAGDQLARGFLKKDGPALAGALGELFREVDGVPERMESLRTEMQTQGTLGGVPVPPADPAAMRRRVEKVPGGAAEKPLQVPSGLRGAKSKSRGVR